MKNEYQKNNLNDKAPQMMAYGGAVISPSLLNLNGKIGYFVANSMNFSFNFGISSASGSLSKNLGLSVYQRYHVIIIFGSGFTIMLHHGL